MQFPNKVNQIIYLIIIAQKGDKLIRLNLGSIKFKYDDAMKQKLRKIAYTLTFE